MGRIYIHAFGKLKDAELRAVCRNYLDRIGHYCRIEMIERKPGGRTPGNRPGKGFSNHRQGRSVRGVYVFLDSSGTQLSSLEFARMLRENLEERDRDLYFVIGDPFGFSTEKLEKVDRVLSLSTLTFPYQLARVILLEQIYRAFTIIKGIPYHK